MSTYQSIEMVLITMDALPAFSKLQSIEVTVPFPSRYLIQPLSGPEASFESAEAWWNHLDRSAGPPLRALVERVKGPLAAS
jgi:hypothetical protein